MIIQPVAPRQFIYLLCGLIGLSIFFAPLFRSHGQASLLFTGYSVPWRKAESGGARWLIATMSDARNPRRRAMIRDTWQRLYADPSYDTKFILSNHDVKLNPTIDEENATYHDLIRLESVMPGEKPANTIKGMELFKYLVSTTNATAPHYDFVTKLDDDVFLVATKFHKKYIRPRLTAKPVSSTIIGRLMMQTQQFVWPQGSFYTLSWDLVTTLAELHTKNPITDQPEDVLIGKLLSEADVKYDFVKLDAKQAFDLPGPDARPPGIVTEKAIAPHKLKDEETFMQVAELFDEKGWNGKTHVGITDNDWKTRTNVSDK